MGKSILAAESEDSELSLLQRALPEAGVTEFQVVRSSSEVIRYIAGEPPYDDRNSHPFPALLLLGLHIGRHGGADVLRWLQQRPELKKRLPVVVFTSIESSQEMEAAYAWGASSCLLRPMEFGRLVSAVRQTADYWLRMNRLP